MVIIYSTPTCRYCDKAKEIFDDLGLGYVEHNVARDPARRKEMVNISGQTTVPVILIDDKLIVGFQEEIIRKYAKQLRDR